MRTRLTLFILCLFAVQAKAWDNELYVLGGAGKNFRYETSSFSGNFGMGTTSGARHGYFNAGLGLHYLSGSTSENYLVELALGGGFRYKTGKATIKVGPDVGMNFSLVSNDLYLSIIPKASITFDLGGVDLGIMVKGTLPFSAPGLYCPQFWGGGIMLRL